MKDILPKIKSFYKSVVTKKETYKRHGIVPAHHWSLIVIISSFFFCVLGLFGYYVFYLIKNDRLFTVKENAGFREIRINRPLLKKTIDDINAREEYTNNLRISGVKTSDPSF